jgi:hypothetical protein
MADEGEALRTVVVRFKADVEGDESLEHISEGADHAKEHVKEAGEHAEKTKGFFSELGETLTGVAAVFGASELLHGIRETTESLEQLAHLSEQTGIATEKLEFYGFVVGQVGGDVGDFRMQLSSLQRALSSTESATAPQTAALKKLGIETSGLKDGSEDMNTILPQIFENFGKLKNPAEEAAVATRLFGRSGLALLPVLREGAKGFEEYRQKFEETGGATPQESIERAKEYERAIKLMNAAFGDLKTHLVTGVLPALTHATEWVTSFTSNLGHFLKGTTASEHAVFALAAAFAGPLFAALKPFLLPGLKFLAIYAAVDDVLAFLEGKDSLLGRALDGVFGSGTADKVRAWVLDAKNAFLDFQGSAQATFEALNSSQSTFTEKALASFVAFMRDASNGFPVLGASWKMNLDGMAASLVEFIADALDKWNTLVQGIKIPPAITALASLIPGAGPALAAAAAAAPAAAVNTADLRATAGGLRQDQADRAAEVGAGLRGIKSNVFGTAAGGDVARQLSREQAAQGPAARTAATLTGDQAKAGEAAQQFAVLGAAHAAGISANVTNNNDVKVNLPPGTSKDSELAKMVGKAVADALAANNRTALQQITQRGTILGAGK